MRREVTRRRVDVADRDARDGGWCFFVDRLGTGDGVRRGVVHSVDGDAAARRGDADGTGAPQARAAVGDIDVVEIDVLGRTGQTLHDAEPHLHIGR